MFIVEVIPIKKSLGKETLSYISSSPIKEGSIVLVPIRNQTVKALVVSVLNAVEQKAAIKDLDFELRQLHSIDTVSSISHTLFQTLQYTSIQYAIPLGSVIAEVLRDEVFEQETLLTTAHIQGDGFYAYAIQQKNSERFDIYKSIIREHFAKKQSVFVVGATTTQTEHLFEHLKKGIEEHSLLLETKSKKSFSNHIAKIIEPTHPLLIVGTANILPLIPKNTGVIIVDGEHSRFFRKRTRPFVDMRFILETFAQKAHIKIFFGDVLLRIDTHFKIHEGTVFEYGHIPKILEHPIKTLTIDLKEAATSPMIVKKGFQVFSKELKEMIMYAVKKNKKMFLFSLRRGVATQTVCLDCGNVVVCDHCESPVILHKKVIEGKNVFTFVCHHCGKKRDTLEVCKTCGSWRLEGFGIGTGRIVEEVEKLTGQTPFVIDSDTTKTKSAVKKILKEFQSNSGILVGTDMAFDYLEEGSVDYTAITSFDSLFSMPDFRANEHIMRLILKTKLIASENMLLQGRNTGEKIIELGLSGSVGAFVKDELKVRKEFEYPPYKTFINISIEQKKEALPEDIRIIHHMFHTLTPITFPALIKSKRLGYHIAHILLSVNNSAWPEESIRQKLLSLPPYMTVKVYPESLL